MNLVDFSEKLTTSVHTLYVRVYRITNKCASFLSPFESMTCCQYSETSSNSLCIPFLPTLGSYLPRFQLYPNDWSPATENYGIERLE